MRKWLFALFLLVPVALGCQSHRFANLGLGPRSTDDGLAKQAFNDYAKEHGLSQREASKALDDERQQSAAMAAYPLAKPVPSCSNGCSVESSTR